jgi:PAS domain S-box-containing protein
VTEQKRLEAQLREAEERYRRQSDVAFEAIAIHDRGVILDVNASFLHLFGYGSTSEVIGRNALDLGPPEQGVMVAERIASGSEEPYEALGLRKDGTTFAAELRSRSVTWGGRLVRVTAIRNMEEERRWRRQAHESAERLRLVMKSAPLFLFAVNSGGTLLISEGRALERLGLLHETIVGQPAFTVFRDAPALLANLRRALDGEELTAEVELVTFGVTWQASFAPLYDERGRRDGTIGVALDITARKLAEREREQLLRNIDAERLRYEALADELSAVLDHMVEAVIVCDRAGTVVRSNRAAFALFGVDSIAALTQRWDGAMLRPDGARFFRDELPLSRALEGHIVDGEELLVRADRAELRAEHSLRVSAAPIRDRDGKIRGAVAVVSDVTAEIALEQLKDQFLSVAAHELKTPVANIKLAAQSAIELSAHEPAALQRIVERMLRGINRIDRIVADLLDASQLRLGRLALHNEPLDLGALVAEVARQSAGGSPRHQVRVSCAPEVQVSGDRLRLGQVVTVLVHNAIKYSPDGGEIDVTVTREGDEAVVSVRDRGIGIPRDKQAHIFSSFFTAHADTSYDFGGVGIGLHVAREFVKRHGGRMWFDSAEGAGSTFAFALPLHDAQ